MKAIGIIDIQKDFMNENGMLCVPNAESIVPELERVCMNPQGLPMFFTADDHDGTEPEMSVNGGQFPLHCMRGTEGKELILDPKNCPVFTKRCYDVFDEKYGSLNIIPWLKKNEITEVDLCGVVGNICVQAAALGLINLGIKTRILSDAVVWMDLGPDNNKETSVAMLREKGVLFS